MKRYDLRKQKTEEGLLARMKEIMDQEAGEREVILFLFEVKDFTPVTHAMELMKKEGHELMNSLKFNEVDWTLTVKRKAS